MTAKTNRRWMQAAMDAAATSTVQMPWARGPRRAAMLARRDSAKPVTSISRGLAAR